MNWVREIESSSPPHKLQDRVSPKKMLNRSKFKIMKIPNTQYNHHPSIMQSGVLLYLARAGLLLCCSLLAVCHTDAAKPVGIHLDIEVHSLAGWQNSSNQQAWGNEWLDLMGKLADLTAGSTPLTVDFAMQYSNVVQIYRDGETRSLADWALDVLDNVVLMAYRDYANGDDEDCTGTNHMKCGETDSIVFHSQKLLDLARKGTTVKIGVETNPETIDKVNFGLEGEEYMERALSKVIDHFSPSPQFEGIVVHDLKHATELEFTDASMRATAADRACRSVWLWDGCYVIENQAACDDDVPKTPEGLVALALEHSINNVIVDSEWFFEIYRDDLKKFVNVLGENDISVELLFANNSWSRADNHSKIITLVKEAVKFIGEMEGSVTKKPLHCKAKREMCKKCNKKGTRCMKCKKFNKRLLKKECKYLFGKNPKKCAAR